MVSALEKKPSARIARHEFGQWIAIVRNKTRMGRRIFLWVFQNKPWLLYGGMFVFSYGIHGQLPMPVKGSITDSISVGGPENDSYALYLPQSFRHGELSPIVFIFHPAAQGRHGLLPFLGASEKYGYILVCSNDSKNGPYDGNYEISNRLINKVLTDFNIDPSRIYAAGFSGGARLASSIAVLSGQIQGVIACGAGFSPNEMTIEPGFSYAAIVGNRDFNYSELLKTRGWLDKLNFPNELFEFELRHQWPDTSQVQKAFKWLQMEAYRKGVLPVDPATVMSIYRDFYQHAREYERKGQWLWAAAEYERIIRNFSRYYELDSIQRFKEDIKSGKFYKGQRRQLLRSLETENEVLLRYHEQLSGTLAAGSTDISWWERELGRLRTRYGDTDQYSRNMLERVLSTVSAIAFEAVTGISESVPIDQKIFCYDLCILAYPSEPYPYFRQIENHLALGNKDKAILYLEKLIQSGFGNSEYLKEHKVVQPLKTHRRFNELLPP
jgi:hypothetical protein